MRIDGTALGKIKIDQLAKADLQIFEKCLEEPEALRPWERTRLEEIFREQKIDFATHGDLLKADKDALSSRYKEFLKSRNVETVRGLSDADFQEASAMLERGIFDIANRNQQ